MQKPWQAEKVVTKELAIKLIAVECPTLRIDSIHFFGEGWDNTVFIVNDTLVFRFPRREAAVPWLLTEIQCLPLIQNQFALDIPKFMYKGKPSQDYSWPFVGYKLVEGESIDKLHWPRQQRNDNAEILGHALRQLHSLKLGVNTENMASEDLIHRLSPQKRTPQILARLQIIEERNLYPHSLDSLRDFVLRQTFDLT